MQHPQDPHHPQSAPSRHAAQEGLAQDLAHWRTLPNRRGFSLQLLAGLCAAGSSAVARAAEMCSLIPSETAGPFPANGSGRGGRGVPNVLTLAGAVRSDLRRGIGAAQAVAQGVPLTLQLELKRSAADCRPAAGMAVYLWHCDREGRYSLYAPDLREQNYLRGVQVADAAGRVSFTTVFPGCYPGRMPHLHFEVYATLADAAAGRGRIVTSQIAFPNEASARVYREAEGYAASRPAFEQMSFARDMVFADGTELQMPALEGSPAAGFTARLAVGL